MSRKILGCGKEKFLPDIMEAFIVDAASPVKSPFPTELPPRGKASCSSQPGTGTQVEWSLPD